MASPRQGALAQGPAFGRERKAPPSPRDTETQLRENQ
jgi:hypothetical protein